MPSHTTGTNKQRTQRRVIPCGIVPYGGCRATAVTRIGPGRLQHLLQWITGAASPPRELFLANWFLCTASTTEIESTCTDADLQKPRDLSANYNEYQRFTGPSGIMRPISMQTPSCGQVRNLKGKFYCFPLELLHYQRFSELQEAHSVRVQRTSAWLDATSAASPRPCASRSCLSLRLFYLPRKTPTSQHTLRSWVALSNYWSVPFFVPVTPLSVVLCLMLVCLSWLCRYMMGD